MIAAARAARKGNDISQASTCASNTCCRLRKLMLQVCGSRGPANWSGYSMNIGKTVRWIVTGFGALFLVPVVTLNVEKLAQQQNWDGFLTSAWGPLIVELSQLAQNGWFLLLAGIVVGIALGLWISELLPRKAAKKSYTETRIRFTQDPSAPGNFLERSKTNIYAWQQVYSQIAGGNNVTLMRHDCFFFVFEQPTNYNRPTIDSFGVPLPPHNWSSMTERAAVLQFTGEIKAGSFEVHFPPL